MMAWRRWALAAALLLSLGGVIVWDVGGGPVLLIFGAIAVVTALLEPIYGRANGRPLGADWRPTDERFVDPESGQLVTVWFDPNTGERRYVADGEAQGGR